MESIGVRSTLIFVFRKLEQQEQERMLPTIIQDLFSGLLDTPEHRFLQVERRIFSNESISIPQHRVDFLDFMEYQIQEPI